MEWTLESVRESLIRQEDTIIFSLIERAKYPINSQIYAGGFAGSPYSLVEYLARETEALQSKAGRYESPEENPFFPDNLPAPLMPSSNNQSNFLHPAGASVNINQKIWDLYFNELLPLFVSEGDDDGNYSQTAASDFLCLQALSRRIHFGKFVAEVKFRDAPQDYEPAILNEDRNSLMKLLTFEKVEEMVKRRVEKKARVFGQEVNVDHNENIGEGKYKIDPENVSHLYGEWLIPLTKVVEVDYLLRRLSSQRI
ncbi:chorismate mutase 2 [Impatiens glandulifera]|uniref:chorismate mutase 2 n=1 Tax=Impatiens glandulifera TaxID=253017 RepID=UPI001FB0CBF4|nr:chorismate mutase 2 [Impatiens glandulifera]